MNAESSHVIIFQVCYIPLIFPASWLLDKKVGEGGDGRLGRGQSTHIPEVISENSTLILCQFPGGWRGTSIH
jgi:hypothetical protein